MNIRLSKLMSERGICSRREADQLIEKGLVRVDGQLVDQLGTKVDPSSKIEIDEKARSWLKKKVTILYNKPVGIVSGQPEGDYKAAIEMIRPENHAREDKGPSRLNKQGLAPAGRLDIDSKGLLILTQDGTVAKQLIGPESEVEKEYLVFVEGELSSEVCAKLRFGLSLDGRKLRKAQVEQLSPQKLKMTLTEGRKRQIRRMCELVELKVTGLKRVRIGKVMLSSLKEGEWRYLRDDESFV